MIGAIIFTIIYFIYMTIKEGSPAAKGCAWTVVGIFGFIFMLADAGVDSDGLGAAFWILVLIAIVVGIAIFISRLTSGTETPRPISPQAPYRQRQNEPVGSEPEQPSVNTISTQPPVAMDERRTHANVICCTSQSTQLQMEKNQIDHDIDTVEKRLNEFLDKYRAT